MDRITCSSTEQNQTRVLESTVNAFSEGNGMCAAIIFNKKKEKHILNNSFEENGIQYTEPTLDFFSFNNPLGACPTCEGYGKGYGNR